MDLVVSHHISQERQPAAVPELLSEQPHQSPKQSHAEDHIEQTEATSGEVPAGSPSRGGDVKFSVLDINQASLPTPFILFLCLFLSYGPFTCISFHKFSRQLSVSSLCSPSLISASLPRSGELRTHKLKSHLVRTQS